MNESINQLYISEYMSGWKSKWLGEDMGGWIDVKGVPWKSKWWNDILKYSSLGLP